MKKRKALLALLLSVSMAASMNPSLLQVINAEEIAQMEDESVKAKAQEEQAEIVSKQEEEITKPEEPEIAETETQTETVKQEEQETTEPEMQTETVAGTTEAEENAEAAKPETLTVMEEIEESEKIELFAGEEDTLTENQKKFVADAEAINWDEPKEPATAYAKEPTSANRKAYEDAMATIYTVYDFYYHTLTEDERTGVAEVFQSFDQKKLEVETIANSVWADFIVDDITYEPLSYDGDTKNYTAAVKGRSEYNFDSFNNVSGAITIPDTVQGPYLTYKVVEIQARAFSAKDGITSITLRSNINSIGEAAFQSCHNLTTVTFSDSVKSIKSGAFEYCEKLTSADLPANLKDIGANAFSGTSLTDVGIPNTLTSMGEACFAGCTSLTTVTFDEPCQISYLQGFGGCTALQGFTIPDSVTEIAPYAFFGAKFDGDIVLPKHDMAVDEACFYNAVRSDGSPLRLFVSGGSLWVNKTDGNPIFDRVGNQKIYYPIHVSETEHGTVSISSDKEGNIVSKDGTTYALSGAAIRINTEPEKGYYAAECSAQNQEQSKITVTDNTFNMGDAIGKNEITVSVTFDKIKHEITSDKTELSVNANEGYSTVTGYNYIRNTGNQEEVLTIEDSRPQEFTTSLAGNNVMSPNNLVTLMVKPTTGLKAGTYKETVTLKTESGLSQAFEVTFTVNQKLETVISDDVTIPRGSSVTLTASLTGGSGNYTYAWSRPLEEFDIRELDRWEDDMFWHDPFMFEHLFVSTDSTYEVTPSETTKYFCRVSDGNEIVTKIITVTVRDPYLLSITTPDPVVIETNGTEKTAEALGLPETIAIVTEDETVTSASVNWNVDEADYDPSVVKEQIFTINGTITVPEGIDQHGVSTDVSVQVTVKGAPHVSTVDADVASGTYETDQTVTLTTATEDAVIYYTTDGTKPDTENGTQYESPVLITGNGIHGGEAVTTTIKAIAVKKGMQDSEVADFTYTIALPAYEITDGADSTWGTEDEKAIAIRGTGELSKFVEAKVDGNTVDPNNYELKSGSTILTFKNAYLSTLKVGKHICEMIWTDGTASTSFTITEKAETETNQTETETNQTEAEETETETETNQTEAEETETNQTESNKTGTANAPKTADTTPIVWWVLALFGSGFGIAGYATGKKRIKRND